MNRRKPQNLPPEFAQRFPARYAQVPRPTQRDEIASPTLWMLKEHYAGKLRRCATKSKVGDVSFTASADDRPMTDISRRIAAEILSPSLVCISGVTGGRVRVVAGVAERHREVVRVWLKNQR